jgi:hypothetical protein
VALEPASLTIEDKGFLDGCHFLFSTLLFAILTVGGWRMGLGTSQSERPPLSSSKCSVTTALEGENGIEYL